MMAARTATPSPPSKRVPSDSNSETESEVSADSSSSTIKEEPDTEEEEATRHNALTSFLDDDEDTVARRRNDLIDCLPPSILTVPRAIKTIEIMPMSAEEVLAEATRSGALKWIKKLIPQVEDDKYDAVLDAIKRGRIPVLKMLFPKFGCSYTIEASVTTAGCGHLVILSKILHESRQYPIAIRHEASWKALSEAAANGHLPVVKFAMDQAIEYVDWSVLVAYTPASRLSDALSRVISGRHRSVVKAFLDPSRFHWTVSTAFEQAHRGRHFQSFSKIRGRRMWRFESSLE
ncbi:hypothetical protein PHYPSEUDO_003163 [Phytophthora pseudosyringae]|uniref:Ankyrin repeat protein n=1 Tax=Phytophthora pseudosyringae TaxID=221518 RepID=A0A8T1VWQ4_9STRA|nr:hypothetical protein PHYPSEUDO_003163 [Phytophthora pseudosyringae]